MKKIVISLTFLILLSLLVSSFLPIHGEEALYDAVIRFHVIANSDTDEDQALKLQVRDALLEKTSTALEGLSKEEAETYLEEHLCELETVAKEVIENAGYDYPVSASLSVEEYPTKNYDSIAFPAGEYLSLQIKIGKSEGKNWWCCLFPPLCLGISKVAKTDAEDAFLSVGLTPSQYKVLTESDTPTYKVRFKLLELFQKKR